MFSLFFIIIPIIPYLEIKEASLNIFTIFLLFFSSDGNIKGLALMFVVPYSKCLLYGAEDVTRPTKFRTSYAMFDTKNPVSVAGYSPFALDL